MCNETMRLEYDAASQRWALRLWDNTQGRWRLWAYYATQQDAIYTARALDVRFHSIWATSNPGST